jgi:hypothetical protein
MEDLSTDSDELDIALQRQLGPASRRSWAERQHSASDVEFAVGPTAGWVPSVVAREEEDQALTELDEATIRRLVATLGVPRARLEEMLAKAN